MIPDNIMKKYELPTFSSWKEAIDAGIYPDYMELYNSFLLKTDHIPNKILEELLENLATANLTNFVGVFINFIVDIRGRYKDILAYRKLAREEINKIEETTE